MVSEKYVMSEETGWETLSVVTCSIVVFYLPITLSSLAVLLDLAAFIILTLSYYLVDVDIVTDIRQSNRIKPFYCIFGEIWL